MKTNKKKGRWNSIISFICFLFIGFGCGLSFTPFLDYFLSDEGNLIITILGFGIMLLLFYIAFVLTITIHEAGHLVFGLLTGYRFGSFRIGSYVIRRVDGKLRIKRFSLKGTGGQCLMYPPSYSEDFPCVLYNAGGAIFNFLTAIISLPFTFQLSSVPFLSSFFIMFCFLSFGIGLMNIIPLIYGNDGSNIKAIKKSKIERDSFWTQMKMNEEQSEGCPLKDLDENLFPVKNINQVEGILSASSLYYQECWLMSNGGYEEAYIMGKELLNSEYIQPIVRTLLKCNLIYLTLILDKDKNEVDKLKDKAQTKEMKGLSSLLEVMRTEYTYALLYEEMPSKALDIEAKFNKTALSYPSPSEVEGERELMERAKEKAELKGIL